MSAAPAKQAAPPVGGTRWIVCALLFAALALSYIDRQVLSVLEPTLARKYNWTPVGYGNVVFYFQLAYAVGYLAFGRIVDKIGARAGYAIAVSLWTIGHMAHAFVTSSVGFSIVRIPLGLGEAGAFPASLAAIAEWFPTKERTLAIGLFNAGTNIGAILAPLIVPIVTLAFGWQMAFILTGLLTVVWLVVWLRFYRRPREHRGVSPQELAHIESDRTPDSHAPTPWIQLLRRRQTWAYMAGRFLIDPIWWTFLFWLPDFFDSRYHLNLKSYGPPLVAIYVLADLGSIAGGWGSSTLLGRGWNLNLSRKTAMLLCALVVVPVAFAANVGNIWLAVGLLGLACAGHQGFSANLYALPSDLFPRWAAGSVVGLGGAAGATGGMLIAKFNGYILQATDKNYTPIFIMAACAYLVALGVVHLLVPRYERTGGAEV
ncbi:MAG: MFS transporter [Rhizomicrobium sp.]